MRKSYVAVLVALAGILTGCGLSGMMKQYMPAPSANKPLTVPGNAGLCSYGTPDVITLPSNSPGGYWIVEDDTSKIVEAFNVGLSDDSKKAYTPAMRDQLDAKRKYRVYYLSNKDSTQPATMPS